MQIFDESSDPTESIGILHSKKMMKILSNEINHFPLLLHSNKRKLLLDSTPLWV